MVVVSHGAHNNTCVQTLIETLRGMKPHTYWHNFTQSSSHTAQDGHKTQTQEVTTFAEHKENIINNLLISSKNDKHERVHIYLLTDICIVTLLN